MHVKHSNLPAKRDGRQGGNGSQHEAQRFWICWDFASIRTSASDFVLRL